MEIATSRALQDKLYDKRKGGALEYVTPYLCTMPLLCGSHQKADMRLGWARSLSIVRMKDRRLPWMMLV
jgi:hypothetical protein